MGITNPKLMYLLRGSVSNLRQYFQVYSRKRIGRNNKAARYRLQATYIQTIVSSNHRWTVFHFVWAVWRSLSPDSLKDRSPSNTAIRYHALVKSNLLSKLERQYEIWDVNTSMVGFNAAIQYENLDDIVRSLQRLPTNKACASVLIMLTCCQLIGPICTTFPWLCLRNQELMSDVLLFLTSMLRKSFWRINDIQFALVSIGKPRLVYNCVII